ncbi:ParB/RepB/Spo0J family partition protein [Streptomyces sp. NPDC002559]
MTGDTVTSLAPTSWRRLRSPGPDSVPVDALLDGASPRLRGVDQEHVAVLAEAADTLPPIVVHHPSMRVIDGVHRLHAARRMGRRTIDVVWFDGTEAEAFLHAVEANIRHGLPLTLADRKDAARRVLRSHPQWSDRAIAGRTGLSGKTVGVLRRAQVLESGGATGAGGEVRIGSDGRARALNPAKGRLRCWDVLVERGGDVPPLREIAGAAGVSVETARDVRERWYRGENPLPTGAVATVPAPAESVSSPAVRPTGPEEGSDQGTRNAPSGRRSSRGLRRRSSGSMMQPIELDAALDSLRRDPTVRYSNEGRAAVRWLDTHVIKSDEAEIVRQAPTHQATRIAAVARACAATWEALARDLETLAATLSDSLD